MVPVKWRKSHRITPKNLIRFTFFNKTITAVKQRGDPVVSPHAECRLIIYSIM